MHPDDKMSRVVKGKRYTVGTSTLLASDEYWDGHNFERRGRNTFLYKTRGGAFFRVCLSQWQGERDTIEPLERNEAMDLYEHLPEQIETYETAFDTDVEEAAAPGRPPMFEESMKQTAIYLPENMLDWLKSQPGNMSETVRSLIENAMGAE
jgi:hypothetical protein